MTLTRMTNLQDKTYVHVMRILMCIPVKSGTEEALKANGISSAYDIGALLKEDIDELKYPEVDSSGSSTGVMININVGNRNALRHMGNLLRLKQHESNGLLTEAIILQITKDEFDQFRLRCVLTAPVTGTSGSTSSQSMNHELNNFIKGIKRDKTQYVQLKDERQYFTWQRSFLATARSHRIDQVFDKAYVPVTPDDHDLFKEQKKFAYTVLDYVLQTDMGKTIVRKHEATFDAQKVWTEFVEDAKLSTKAQITSSNLLSWLTSAKYDEHYRGTSTGFVLYWVNKVQEYENYIVDPKDKFTDNHKLTMLQNTVNDIAELRQVRINAELEVAKGGNRLNYNQYFSLLVSAANAFDKYHESSKGNPRKQQVYSSQVINEDHEEYDILFSTDIQEEDDDEEFNVDTYLCNVNQRKRYQKPVQTRTQRVHATRSNQDRNFIPKEAWLRIPPDVRELLTAKKKISSIGQGPRKANNAVVEELTSDITQMAINTSSIVSEQPNDNSSPLLEYLSNQTKTAKDYLNNSTPNNTGISKSNNIINVNGIEYRQVNHTQITYQINARHITNTGYALIDRGANGGIFGSDVKIIEQSDRSVSLTGLDNHQITNLPICTGAAYGETHRGPIIMIMHQYACVGHGKTIHSSVQLESYGIEVNDRSLKVTGGLQRLKTPDGYLIPLDIIQGLPYMKLRIPTDHEYNTLPHVILTSDVEWDPAILDSKISPTSASWYTASDVKSDDFSTSFDEFGKYKFRKISSLESHAVQIPSDGIDNVIDELIYLNISNLAVSKEEPHYSVLQPNFGWAPIDVIKQTFKNTTQYARSLHLYNDMRKHYKSRFPALNVIRRNEPVATDTVYSDIPAVDNGSRCAQLFVGRDTLVCDVYGMKTDREFVNTLEDNIRRRGAMDLLISDRAKAEVSSKAKDILRALFIQDWQSEPHHQHQNYAERRYATVKSRTNVIMNRTGAPAKTWLLCLEYICFVLNHTATKSLNWSTPLQLLTGQTSDISILLYFHFWEKVYFTRVSPGFPSESNEDIGHFVGFAEHVGDAMTFKILVTETNKVIFRSNVRSATTPTKMNHRLCTDGESTMGSTVFIQSKSDDYNNSPNESHPKPMPGFNPSELIGRTFLHHTESETDQQIKLRIVKSIADHFDNVDKHPDKVKFLLASDDGTINKILAYNEVIKELERNNQEDNDPDASFKFKSITAHQGPLKKNDPKYKGSKYNILVEWEDGEATYEPLELIGCDDPVSVAQYAKENGLLDEVGWKKYKKFASVGNVLTQLLVNRNILCSYHKTMKSKYGYFIPNNHAEAIELDRINKNTKWQDAERLEIESMGEYNVFTNLGKDIKAPEGYKKIRCHIIYDVKHDGRHKARLVAGGHLTPLPDNSIYSGVVTLRGLRIIIFIAEHNGLQLWGGDITCAYLEALTKEMIYFIAGPEFGELEGHTMLVFKALYGLRSSGLRWHERLADILRDMGFWQCIGENDIWMRENDGIYEYIAVYVDDLAIAARDPASIINILKEKHNLKLKSIGPLSFHLGCDFFRDPDNTFCYGPKKYIDKMVSQFDEMFQEKPKEYSSPLEKNDHPELDDSKLLDSKGITQYQSMIGAAQWAVSLGRFDIHTAVMTMSQFRIAPRQGHLNRLKRIYGYLRKFKEAAIRVRTELPDLSDVHELEHDWLNSIYGNVSELIPVNIPKPLGKKVILTHYVDANLYHDLITGRAVTGVLHFINQTPVEWYSKKQSTVETATYGAEFVAARIAVDQIIDLRTTLRYMGVNVEGKSYLFGDNNSVIISATIPHSSLKKRHNALSYHRVREAICAKILGMFKTDTKRNYADFLSKHSGYQQAWPLLRPLLFFRGYEQNRLRTNGECEAQANEGYKPLGE